MNQTISNGRSISAAPVAAPSGLRPARQALEGRYVRLEPCDPQAHRAELFAAASAGADPAAIWTYLPYGPYADLAAFTERLEDCTQSEDPLFFTLRDKASGQASGMASYLNIVPQNGSIEIGHIWFAPTLQRTPAATEGLYLMMRQAFDELGYRRLEWKCNARNEASRRAALRLGFTFEGIFYQHMVVKGCNRDSAWFSILDGEWPRIRANFERWLAPDNFDSEGRQRVALASLNCPT